MRRSAKVLTAVAIVAVAWGCACLAQEKVAMLGGSPSRNQANLEDKNIPDDFSTKKGKEKNVKWVAPLGNKSPPGRVAAGDRLFVPTDNGKPRDPKVKGYRGVLMCFSTADGKFLWQQAHPKADDANDAQ